MNRKAVILSISLLILVGMVSASLDIEIPDPDTNQYELSPNSSNAITTQLWADFGGDEQFYVGEEHIVIDGDQGSIEEELQFTDTAPYYVAEYVALNESSGETFVTNQTIDYNSDMDAWILEFEPNTTQLEEIDFKVNMTVESPETGDTNKYDRNHLAEEFEVVETDVTFIRDSPFTEDGDEVDFSSPLKPGLDLERLDVDVFNTSTEEYLTDEETTVEVYFNNISDTFERQDLGEYVDEENLHRTSQASIPNESDTSMIMTAIALDTEGNSISSESFVVELAELLEGEISEISSEGCEGSIIPEGCEPEAELTALFDITSSNAEEVNVTLEAYNQSSESFESVIGNNSMTSVDSNDGVEETYESSFTIPDLNTSEYDKSEGLNFVVNAENNLRSTSDLVNIDFDTFEIVDDTRSTLVAGQEYSFEILARKPYTRNVYSEDRFEQVTVNLESSDFEYSELYELEDLDFDESIPAFTADFIVPEDAGTGPYDINTNIVDIYGESKSNTKGITVEEANKTFDTDNEINLEYDSIGLFEEVIEVENLQDQERTLSLSTDVEPLILEDSYSLASNSIEEIDFDVNLTELESHTGEIVIEDETGYQEVVELSISVVNCEVESGNLCSQTENLDISTTSNDEFEEQFNLTNLGSFSIDVNMSVEGNVSNILDVDESMELEPGTSEVNTTVNPDTSGFYEGNITVESDEDLIDIPVSGEVSIGDTDLGLTTDPSLVELTLPEGEDEEIEITLTNTGEDELTDIRATADNHELDMSSIDLQSGEDEDYSIIVSESDTIVFDAESGSDTITAETTVTVDQMDDFSDRADELGDRVADLRVENEDPSLDDQLTDVTVQADRVRDQWDNGDYDQAQQTFNEAEASLDELDTEIQSQQTDTGGGGDQTQDPGQNGDSQEDGGLPIIPIIAILAILMLIGGFIFFESYIPEEGDPLYGVLN